MLLVALGMVSFRLALTDVQLLLWTMWVPGAFAFGAALFVCQYYGHRAWRVPRNLPAPTEVVST